MNAILVEESVKWNDELRGKLIRIYKDALNGSSADNGLKKQEWTVVLKEFNGTAKVNFTKAQLQSQIQSLKAKYSIFKALRDNSGFGWDSLNKLPTAEPDTWNRYFEAHPKAREFKNKTLVWAEELAELFDGRTASGLYAVSSSNLSSLLSASSTSPADELFESEYTCSIDEVMGDEYVHSAGTATVNSKQPKRKRENQLAAAILALAATNKPGLSEVSRAAIAILDKFDLFCFEAFHFLFSTLLNDTLFLCKVSSIHL
jgi:hypothetical protein